METLNEIVNELIEYAKNNQYDSIQFLSPHNKNDRLLWDHGEEYWQEVCKALSTDDIIYLLKGMVYADGRFKNWSTYSVVHYCHYLLGVLLKRFNSDYTEYDNLMNWIFKNRCNTYLPYIGDNIPLGVTCLEEYRKYSVARKEEWEKREEEKKKEYDEAQIRKKARKELAIENRKNNLAAQLKRRNDREIFLTGLKAKTQFEVLKTITADIIHSVYYYPEEFSIFDEDVLGQLSSREKQILIIKLKNSRGSWKTLKKKLKNSLSNEF